MTASATKKPKAFKLPFCSGPADWDEAQIKRLTNEEIVHEYNERMIIFNGLAGSIYSDCILDEITEILKEAKLRGIPSDEHGLIA